MSVIPSLAAGLVQLQALANFLDQGSGNATFVYFDSTKPANVGIASDPAAKLVMLNLPKPCFKALLVDGIELHPTDTGMAINAGVVKWTRLYNGAGVAVADFSMGIDIILNSYDIALGSFQQLDSIILKPFMG
ncbi:hypothetical protein QTA56_03395 [Acinetobacter sp. VNH17]|uniref:Uncharacterized protein n=1 Tax=Acinetobacter thutiue TaxID=2998078 RepID=A0ABT7WKR8_9GAMM|nr:hypothetical protein [Acinetobacter thutiue]MCY6411183.1 hypothetical protein [Acinetobacter thutiue]MDN0013285.1 hypothetical protein [Acinetobacter thutiue]